MTVGFVRLGLRLSPIHSLKEKRRVLQSILRHLRQNLHLSAAEVGDQELWGNAEIGFADVSPDAASVESQLDRAIRWVEEIPEVQGIQIERESLTI